MFSKRNRLWFFAAAVAVATAAVAVFAPPGAQAVNSVYGAGLFAQRVSAVNSGTTATDDAYLEARVSGTAAGDPHLRLTIPSGTSWYVGADNSDSDKLKIGTGAAVGTNTLMTVQSSGEVGIGVAAPGSLLHVQGTSTSTIESQVANLNNSTVTSQARLHALTGGSGGGDPMLLLTVSGALDYYVGLDNSASDAFIIGSGNAVGTNPHFQIDTATGNATFFGSVTMSDAKNVVLNTSTGTQIGTATTQKLGLWGATPVVQQNTTGTATGFTAGAGTTVTHLSTFTGNLGSTAYTIADIVLALKRIGALAQ